MRRRWIASTLFLPVVALLGCAEHKPLVVGIVHDISAQRIQSNIEKLVSFGTRNTLSETQSETHGIGAARRWIESELRRVSKESGGRLQVKTQSYTAHPDGKRITRDVEIVNVIATLPGTDFESAKRLYVITGHYDSMPTDPKDGTSDAPGANDDASGTAAVMELARVMSSRKFDATIVFAAVAGEEQGLLGSKLMAQKYKEWSTNVAGMLTDDIIGSSLGANGVRDRSHVRVFSEGVPISEASVRQREIRFATGNENDSPSRQLARYVDECAHTYVPWMNVMLIWRRDRFLRGGDHTSFSEQGYPAIRFTETNEDFAHQHQNVRVESGKQFGDLPTFVDYQYIANVARINAAALANLAMAPAVPVNVRVLTTQLETTTTLVWDANKEPDLAGYEIVWRETTAPRWEHSQSVGKVTRFTHPLTKDNFIFGVRAVDREGYRSVVSYPTPAKS